MSILTKMFSGGAADLIKSVGGVVDNLTTSKEEKLEAERKIKELIANYEVEMEKNIYKSITNDASEYTGCGLCRYRNPFRLA